MVCVLCVQGLAECLSELQDPSITEKRRAVLKIKVQDWENAIQHFNGKVASHEKAIKAKQLTLSGGKGKEG